MCFTPIVSISTAILEFIVATFILLYYNKSKISKAMIVLIYCLGIYQFSEYMLCTSNNQILWAKVGFIAYTLLPALGLTCFLKYDGKKHNTWIILALPIIFSIFAILKEGFIVQSSCEKYFVIVRYLFFNSPNIPLMAIYTLYYFGFITYIFYLIISHYKRTQDLIKKKIDMIFLTGLSISLFPALILLFLFPTLAIKFPSIYCHFAIVFAVCAMIGYHLDNKILKHPKRKTKMKK